MGKDPLSFENNYLVTVNQIYYRMFVDDFKLRLTGVSA